MEPLDRDLDKETRVAGPCRRPPWDGGQELYITHLKYVCWYSVDSRALGYDRLGRAVVRVLCTASPRGERKQPDCRPRSVIDYS